MSVIQKNRREKIVEMLHSFGTVSAIELSECFNVSIETIRRDLNYLDKQSLVVRNHGGAEIKRSQDETSSFTNRCHRNLHAKQLLYSQIEPFITKGCVVGIDASTSAWVLAEQLPNIDITVVTNSLKVIESLSNKNKIKIVSLGGVFSEKHQAFYGSIPSQALANMHLDLSIMSCSGFHEEKGVWDTSEINCEIKKSLISASKKNVLAADRSKYNSSGLFKIASYNDFDFVATN